MDQLKDAATTITTRRLIGKSAWVTGADSPIGKAVADRLEMEGATVLRTGQTILPLDPATERDADALLSSLDKLDILISTRRKVVPKPLLDSDETDFDDAIAANVVAPFIASRAAMRKIGRGGGGSIVIVSSIHGEKPTASAPLYSVACGCLNLMVKEAALDFGRVGTRVNLLSVGAMAGDDKLFHSELSAFYDDVATRSPLGVCSPDEVAAAAVFLASPDASFVNGATLVVDGGFQGVYADADIDKRWARLGGEAR